MSPRPRVTVLVGGHEYGAELLAGFLEGAGVVARIFDLGDWLDAGAPPQDVLVFYTMYPDDPRSGGFERIDTALDRAGRAGAGIFVLHHAIFAFPGREAWSDVVGITDRTVGPVELGHRLRIEVAESGHPITTGLTEWEMADETYLMAEPDSRCRVLLTTDHPRSMRAISWAQDRSPSRVLTLQSGHDAGAFGDPSLRAFAARGIRWLSERRTP